MDERVENPELKEIMKTRPEEMNEDQLEAFVDAFMEATFIIPAELNSDVEALEGKTDEEIALDEEIDLEVMRLEDEEENVKNVVEKIKNHPLIPDVPVHGLIIDIVTGELKVLVDGY
jgi:carbonic anhydrase